jgi:uncharacterized protein involved in outer membrane biogenesis
MLGPMTFRRRAAFRKRRWLIILVGLFALYSLGGFFVAPPIIKAQAQKQLEAALYRPVSIGRVRLNPLTLALTIEDFMIRERSGHSDFLGWKRLYINFEVSSFFAGAWRFSAIELDAPRAWVLVNPDGSLNFSDLLAGQTASAPANKTEPAKPLRIDRLVLSGAQLSFYDQSRPQPFATTFGPVGFTVTDFHTMGGEQAPYSFEAVTESGEKFAWHGWIEAAPFRSGGELSVSGLVLSKYAPYYGDRLGVDLQDGVLSVRGRYQLSFDERMRAMKLLDGSLLLKNLKLVERGSGELLFELPTAEINGASADGLSFKAAVRQVALKGGHLRLRREADGSLNIDHLIAPVSEASAANAAPPAAPMPAGTAPAAIPAANVPLSLNIVETSLQDWNIEVLDNGAARPAHLGLAGFSAVLRSFSLSDGAEMPFEIATRWQPQGTVRAAGTVSLKPVKADVHLQVDSLGILPLSPYLEQNVNARLADGDISVKGHATVALRESPPPGALPVEATFDGEAWLEKFNLLDAAHNEELAGFADLVVSGIKVTTTPRLTISLADVNLNAPYARVFIDRDGTLNLATLVKKTEGGQPAKPGETLAMPPSPLGLPVASEPASGPGLEVSRVVINDGDFSFTDRSISPQARAAIREFGGTLTGLSSANPGRGELELKANVGGTGPLAVNGRIDPFGAQMSIDTKLTLAHFDLQPFGPYVGKYAGYELARGNLTLDITTRIAEQRIDMANAVTLDQFTFGRATNSPDATRLPVRLGLALLKDLDGRIELNVPVDGRLDDPGFHVGAVVVRVIVNLLTKAAVSPFSLLGSMFGGGGEELSYQEFAPGGSALSPEGEKKLETLIKALTARPGLSLGIEGGYDAGADSHELKRHKLGELVRRTIWEERHAKDPNIPPPDRLEIKPEESAAMVKKLFDRKFPPGTPLGTPLPPPPMVSPPPPPPEKNLFWKIYDFVTLRKVRQKAAYEAAQKKMQQDYMQQVKIAAATGLPPDEMTGRLVDSMEVSDDELRELADARASRVRDHLVNAGHIAPERLFLTKAPESAGAQGKGPRVFLQLQ